MHIKCPHCQSPQTAIKRSMKTKACLYSMIMGDAVLCKCDFCKSFFSFRLAISASVCSRPG